MKLNNKVYMQTPLCAACLRRVVAFIIPPDLCLGCHCDARLGLVGRPQLLLLPPSLSFQFGKYFLFLGWNAETWLKLQQKISTKYPMN